MSRQKSAFHQSGVDGTVQQIIERTQNIYLDDEIPWVVGYSGGKDSTAIVALIWTAIAALPAENRKKAIHFISTDTLVENPVVALWVEKSLKTMREVIGNSQLPFHAHRLMPEVHDRFWVKLVGSGYPTPRPKFRWCTSRLKISPSNKFISDMVHQNGESILVLGTRKAESSARHANMKKHEQSTRQYLNKNSDPALDRVWVYTPIADWSNDDVWEYLLNYPNPWGYDNSELLAMYRGATKDNECPLVVDSSTPSCGDSRFGCYVCTMVDQDRSMMAMIQNDEENRWMKPLLNIRNNWLDTNDRDKRDFRRMNGALTVYNERLVHGPYKQWFREKLLREILKAQIEVQKLAPPVLKSIELLSMEDLEEIRRIWVMEKHEIEDSLPKIYEEVIGQPYPVKNLDENQIFKPDDMELLKEICRTRGDSDGIHFQLARELLHLEQQYRTKARRAGLFDAVNKALEHGAFESEEEAEAFAVRRHNALQSIHDDTATEHEKPLNPPLQLTPGGDTDAV